MGWMHSLVTSQCGWGLKLTGFGIKKYPDGLASGQEESQTTWHPVMTGFFYCTEVVVMLMWYFNVD